MPGAVHITTIRPLLCGLDRSDFGGLAVKLRLCAQRGSLIAFRGNLLHSIDQHLLDNTPAQCSTRLLLTAWETGRSGAAGILVEWNGLIVRLRLQHSWTKDAREVPGHGQTTSVLVRCPFTTLAISPRHQ